MYIYIYTYNLELSSRVIVVKAPALCGVKVFQFLIHFGLRDVVEGVRNDIDRKIAHCTQYMAQSAIDMMVLCLHNDIDC